LQARQQGVLDSTIPSLQAKQQLLHSLHLIPPEFAPLHRTLGDWDDGGDALSGTLKRRSSSQVADPSHTGRVA
jgi:hypothetical protein